MNNFYLKIIFFLLLITNQSISEENIMILKLKGNIKKFTTKSTIKALERKYV